MTRIPLIGASVLSVQLGAAVASSLFDRVGAPGTVLLRQGFAAALLLVIARPRLSGRPTADWTVVVGFGLVLAAMNACFYEAVARLPLGIAVTIELIGPLGLAAVLSRSRREVAYVVLAALGVVLLGGATHHVDIVGAVFALSAGLGWASYILLSRRTGRRFEGVEGLALAMAVATLAVAPLGIATGGERPLARQWGNVRRHNESRAPYAGYFYPVLWLGWAV
jgi:inner membrane transporter RhtA